MKAERAELLRRIREEYINGSSSLVQLAKKYGVSKDVMKHHCRDEKWVEERTQKKKETGHKICYCELRDPEERAAMLAHAKKRYIEEGMSIRRLSAEERIGLKVLSAVSVQEKWAEARAAYEKEHGKPIKKQPAIKNDDISVSLPEMREAYITGEETVDEIAIRFGQSIYLTEEFARRQNWRGLREKRIAEERAREREQTLEEDRPIPESASSGIDWDAIQMEYVSGAESMQTLAEKYLIPVKKVKIRAQHYNWTTLRMRYRAELVARMRGESPPKNENADLIDDLRSIYVTGYESLKTLCQRFGLDYGPISVISKNDHWSAKRSQYRDERLAKVKEAALQSDEKELLNVRQTGSELIDMLRILIMQKQEEAADPEEINQMSAALEKLQTVMRISTGKMLPEQQARYDLEMSRIRVKEMEADAKLHPAPLTVVWGDPIMEECAK